MNSYKGFYKVENPEKYIADVNNVIYRSSWERKLMVYCDINSNVLEWGSETHVIPYYSELDKKVRRYFIDFFIRCRNNDGKIRNLLVEVKPNKEIQQPKKPRTNNKKSQARYLREVATYIKNQNKWKAARQYAKDNDMEFLIMDEFSLGINK